MQSVQDGQQMQIIKAVATFVILFRACVNIFFIIKVKILVLIKWSFRLVPLPPPSKMLTMRVNIFGACSPISFKHMMPLWCQSTTGLFPYQQKEVKKGSLFVRYGRDYLQLQLRIQMKQLLSTLDHCLGTAGQCQEALVLLKWHRQRSAVAHRLQRNTTVRPKLGFPQQCQQPNSQHKSQSSPPKSVAM